MGNFIPTYRQTKRKVIKICNKCRVVRELTEATQECPECGMVGWLGMWETPAHFKRYMELYKKTDLKIVGDHLQYIADEALGRV